MLADMATEIDASELLIRRASDLKNAKQKMTREGAMAKLYASEACVRILIMRFKSSVVMVIPKISRLKNSIEILNLYHWRRNF
jgi:hypothetical protein